jgi:bifunctional non-homologous end joining protein LigD
MSARETTTVDVEGRALTLSNLSKVLYPAAGFTKAQVIDYYRRIAPVLVPHLRDKPLTLKRYPNGVDDKSFFEKNATKHRPEWIKTTPIFGYGRGEHLHFILCDDTPTLVFVANLAAIELHPSLSLASELRCPRCVVFDLDPGPPADLATCCKAALTLRKVFDRAGLIALAKTSGGKGMQLFVPLNTPATYADTKGWSHAIALDLERSLPELFVSEMSKSLRAGKIFLDWSQNDITKTTVSVYSLRAREQPRVSTPVTWDEVEAVASSGDASPLYFTPEQALARVEKHGDLFAGVLTLKQTLPDAPRSEWVHRGPRTGRRRSS